jgi:alpha-D-xyloside xylohydrolase
MAFLSGVHFLTGSHCKSRPNTEGAPGKQYQNDNVMLARSGWAGSQRYGSAVWSGDTSSSFNDLNEQFRAGLNMVMSGIPYWTSDIGGYNGGNISSPVFRELIVRWFQWGAFCPIFRSHGRRGGGPDEGDNGMCGATRGSNEIWNFGNDSETAIASVMQIREQLRPYIMNQYALNSVDGTPIMRPLFFDFWDDAGARCLIFGFGHESAFEDVTLGYSILTRLLG